MLSFGTDFSLCLFVINVGFSPKCFEDKGLLSFIHFFLDVFAKRWHLCLCISLFFELLSGHTWAGSWCMRFYYYLQFLSGFNNVIAFPLLAKSGGLCIVPLTILTFYFDLPKIYIFPFEFLCSAEYEHKCSLFFQKTNHCYTSSLSIVSCLSFLFIFKMSIKLTFWYFVASLPTIHSSYQPEQRWYQHCRVYSQRRLTLLTHCTSACSFCCSLFTKKCLFDKDLFSINRCHWNCFPGSCVNGATIVMNALFLTIVCKSLLFQHKSVNALSLQHVVLER